MRRDARIDRLDRIAAEVLGSLGEMISALEGMARSQADGRSLSSRDLRIMDHRFTIRQDDQGPSPAVVCTWTSEQYYQLRVVAADRSGVAFAELEERCVNMPAMEFEEDLVTGSFEAWKGISVKAVNPLEEVIDLVESRLEDRGVHLRCCQDGDEILIHFTMPFPED
ncbi:MAG: hypothetical protein GKC10_02820 [Methanosarcinales archaeon]|nr:hypothetical protein [Methanosarcinales archaeon]